MMAKLFQAIFVHFWAKISTDSKMSKNFFVELQICNTPQNDEFFMLNVKTLMAFLFGCVEMELGTYYSKCLKRQNRPYRPVLYLSADGRFRYDERTTMIDSVQSARGGRREQVF